MFSLQPYIIRVIMYLSLAIEMKYLHLLSIRTSNVAGVLKYVSLAMNVTGNRNMGEQLTLSYDCTIYM